MFLALFLAAAVVLLSCTSTPDEPEAVPTTVFIPQTVFVVLTTVPRATTPLPGPEVESCVEQTMYYAFLGNEFWRQAWDDLGQDIDRLRANCADLARTDPELLTAMHVDWLAVEATLVPEPS